MSHYIDTTKGNVKRLEDERDYARSLAFELAEICRVATRNGHWKVDGSCEPDSCLRRIEILRGETIDL